MTPQEFFKKYEGFTKGYPTDKSYPGECLSIAKLFIKEVCGLDNPPPSGTNSAYGYWSNFPDPLGTLFKKITYVPGTPLICGDLPIWKPTTTNSYGHIDILVEDLGNGTFKGFDQNWAGKQAHYQIHNYINLAGVLRLKGAGMATYNFEGFGELTIPIILDDAKKLDGAYQAERNRTVDARNELATEKQTTENLQKKIEEILKQAEIDKQTLTAENEVFDLEVKKICSALAIPLNSTADEILNKIASMPTKIPEITTSTQPDGVTTENILGWFLSLINKIRGK